MQYECTLYFGRELRHNRDKDRRTCLVERNNEPTVLLMYFELKLTGHSIFFIVGFPLSVQDVLVK